MDRLSFPERGANYFSLIQAPTACPTGATTIIQNYTFPDLVEGAIRSYGINGTGVLTGITVEIRVDGILVPKALNTGNPFVSIPAGSEIGFFCEFGPRSTITVTVINANPAGTPAVNINSRLSGWYYNSERTE